MKPIHGDAAHDGVRIVLSRHLADMPVDRAQWNSLVAETPNASVFQTYEWFESWWITFGSKFALFLVTLWIGDSLAGIAPMMIVRRAGLRRLEFVAFSSADYQDFVLGRRHAELLPHLARFLVAHRGEWDMMVLRNVPMDSPTFVALPAAMRSLGLGTTDVERIECPTIEIASRPDDTRRMLERYSFRRRIKRLGKEGEVAFVRCLTPEQLDRYLPLFFSQYVARRRGSVAAETFMRRDVQAFFYLLARSLLPLGWLHFSVLESAGRPIAFHFGFEFGGRLYWYKPSFDPAAARHSPGMVLLSFLIRDAMERNLRELDFTLGGEAFKYRYSNSQRTNANLRVFGRRWLYLAFQAAVRVTRAFRSMQQRLRRTSDGESSE